MYIGGNDMYNEKTRTKSSDELIKLNGNLGWNTRSLTSGAGELDFEVSKGASILLIYPVEDVLVGFSDAEADMAPTYKLVGGINHELRVPLSLGDSIWFHYIQDSAGGSLEVVEQ